MKSITVFLAILVGGNFALDWWRRFDFETEKGVANDVIRSVKVRSESDLADVQILLETLRLQSDTFQKSVDSLSGTFDVLENFVRESVSETAAAKTATPSSPTELEQSDADLILRDPVQLSEIPKLSSAAIMTSLQALRYPENHALAQRFGQFSDHKTWDSERIISLYEEQWKEKLDPKSRELLRCKIEAFKQGAVAAFGKYQMEKNLILAERIKAGDFAVANEFGEFEESDVDPDELFAVTNIGNRRIRWLRSEHPELYRLNLVCMYMPLAMVTAVDREFTVRSSK